MQYIQENYELGFESFSKLIKKLKFFRKKKTCSKENMFKRKHVDFFPVVTWKKNYLHELLAK